MIYTLDFTIPANTTELNRQRDFLRAVKGLMYKLDIYFPDGSDGLAHICINQGASQLWPSTGGDYFEGNEKGVVFDEPFEIDSDPAQFEVYGYNEDTLYEHTIYIAIGVVSKPEFIARFLPTMAYKLMEEEKKNLLATREEKPVTLNLILPFKTKQ